MDELLDLLRANDLFVAGLSVMLVGLVLAGIRYLPGLLWTAMWRKFGVAIAVRDASVVHWLGIWLSEYTGSVDSRWLEATSLERSEGLEAVLRPGPGLHTFRFAGRRFYLYHQLEDSGIAGKRSIMELRYLSADRAPATTLLQEVVRRANRERAGKTAVYIVSTNGWWDLVRLMPPRLPATVFLKPGLLDEIMADASWFFGSEEWYRSRGLPYRRGYLLHGPPGNGKSTIIHALASTLNVPLHLLSFSDPEFNDRHLSTAMGRVPAGSIVVFEDMEKMDEGKSGVTMPGLLNAVDGSLASEARILIATANDADVIHPALLRPGRMDRKWLIGPPTVEAMQACLTRFGVDGQSEAITEKAMAGAWSMAELQAYLTAGQKDLPPDEVGWSRLPAPVSRQPTSGMPTSGPSKASVPR